MLLARSNSNAHVRAALFVSPIRGGIAQWRSMADAATLPAKKSKRISSLYKADQLETINDVAEKLLATGLIRRRAGPTAKANKRPKNITSTTDRSRINLVSEPLCDDILKYYGDTLVDRHRGCDIIDLFPGVGIWSRKLNDLLQPRSHILLEPDARIYEPFLQPLLERPGTKLLAKSGIEFEHIPDILTPEILPHQVEQPTEYPPQRNDTLLLTANLSWHPKKTLHSISSVAQLVMHQFIRSVQTASMFQQYGLVRMLLWICDDEKQQFLPRSVQVRRRLAIEAELFSESVVEVAGFDAEAFYLHTRDSNIDIESAQRTLKRMRDQGRVLPPGREPRLHLDAVNRKEKVVAGEVPPVYISKHPKLIKELEAALTPDSTAEERYKISQIRSYVGKKSQMYETIHELMQERAALIEDFVKADKDDPEQLAALQKRADEFEEKLDNTSLLIRKGYRPAQDNLVAIRQDPPLLVWDRRPCEPVLVKADEFLPNVPCALVDIQPKVPSELLWRKGTDPVKRMPDVLHLALKSLMGTHPAAPVVSTLEKLHAGSSQDLIPNSPSLRDPEAGGSPLQGDWGALRARCLNERQINELMQAWVDSPFTPNYFELIRQSRFETEDTAEAQGNTMGRLSTKNLS